MLVTAHPEWWIWETRRERRKGSLKDRGGSTGATSQFRPDGDRVARAANSCCAHSYTLAHLVCSLTGAAFN